MMTLRKYRHLIAEMPVEDQAFTTKRSTWEGKINAHILNHIFEGQDTVKISRKDLSTNNDISTFIYKVIMWGYPRGMRGSVNDRRIFDQLEKIIPIVNLPSRALLSENDLDTTLKRLSDIPGLGISTISKLLHFRTHKYGAYDCLILDERLMRIFNANLFAEFQGLGGFRYDNACLKYLGYLKTMHEVSLQLDVKPANLEMFLFTFGNNLK